MPYLKRLKARPAPDELSPAEARYVLSAFDVYAGEVLIHDESFRWDEITEIEVAKAARYGGLAGWLVRYLVHGDERYHLGIYAGHREAVLPNITLNAARYVVQMVAYYAPVAVQYSGVEGLSPLVDS